MSSPREGRSTTASQSNSSSPLDSLELVRASLESVQTNIFLADPSMNIIYANDRALETLRGLEEEIRKVFGVEVDQIVGASIHRFHKDKRRVERILRNPASAYSSDAAPRSPTPAHVVAPGATAKTNTRAASAISPTNRFLSLKSP